MATVGSLVVQIAADTAKLTTGLDYTQRQLKSFERNVQSVSRTAEAAFAALGAGFGVSALGGMVREAASAADRIGDLAARSGVAASELSALAYAGEFSGTTAEDIASSFTKLSKSMLDAASGASEQAAAFRVLGVSATTAQGGLRPVSDVFMEIADRFRSMADGSAKAELATNLFGKSGAALIPLLNQGADGLRAMADEGRDLGVVLGDESIERLGRMDDALTRLAARLRGAAATVAEFTEKFFSGGFVNREGALSQANDMLRGEWTATATAAAAENARMAEAALLSAKAMKEQAAAAAKAEAEQRRLNAAWADATAAWAEDSAQRSALKRMDELKRRQDQLREGWRQTDSAAEAFNQARRESDTAAAAIETRWHNAAGTMFDAIWSFGVGTSRTFAQMVVQGRASFRALAQSFLTDLVQIVMHHSITMPLFSSIFGPVAQGFTGGLFGTAGTWMSGALMGAGGSGLSSANDMLAASWSLPARASGGPVDSGRAYLVGERGPEIIVPRTPGTVIPNGSSGGGTYIIDARGADASRLAHLERVIRGLHGSIERRAVGAVISQKRRGGATGALLRS